MSDGLRGLILTLSGAGLLTALTVGSLRGVVLSLLPAAVGLLAGLTTAAALETSAGLLPWSAPMAALAVGLTLLGTIPRDRGQAPGWPPGTWLALQLPFVGLWVGWAPESGGWGLTPLAVGAGAQALAAALLMRGTPRGGPPFAPEACERPAPPWAPWGAAALGALALVGTEAETLSQHASCLLQLAGVIGLGALLWSGRWEGIVLILGPGLLASGGALGLAGWLDTPLPLAGTAAALGLGSALGFQLVGAHVSRLRGEPGDLTAARSSSWAATAVTALGCATLALAESKAAQVAAAPLTLAALLAGIGAWAWTEPWIARLTRPPRRDDSLPRRYRWLGAWASPYAAFRATHDPLLAALPKFARGAERVLVAGCGLGLSVARLAEATDAEITAIDLDASKLRRTLAALTPEERARVKTTAGDLREVELGRPDLILLLDVLRAWSDDDRRALLERLAEALAPKGKLLFRDSCPGPDASHAGLEVGVKLAWWLGLERVGPGPTFASPTDWGRLLNQAGLGVEHADRQLGSAARVVLLCRKPG